MRHMTVAATACITAVAATTAPTITAIGPVRRSLAPRLAGASSSQHIALTFDDGPDPRSTPAFLDLLDRADRRATFFVLGMQAQAHPSLIKRMSNEGHEVAIHGWTHRCTVAIRPMPLRRQLLDAKHVVEDITGTAVQWYRPPFGVLSTHALLEPRTIGLTPVLWTAWGRDWERSATPPRIVATVLRTLRPGGTILLHDTDLHARGRWDRALDATATLLAGPLHSAHVGPLRDHWPTASTQPRAKGQDAPRAVQS